MVVIGVNVGLQIIEQVSIEVEKAFSGIPKHWKRDLFHRAQVVLVPGDAEGSAFFTSDDHFVMNINENGLPVDPEEVVEELILVYLITLVNVDEVVSAVFKDVMTGFGIAHEDMLYILVSWFLSLGDRCVRMSSEAISACEELDRQLCGLYSFPIVTYGLLVQ
jgi:hypothetical protein